MPALRSCLTPAKLICVLSRFLALVNTIQLGALQAEDAVTHGIGVMWSLIRLIVEERPLVMLGIPSLFFLLAGVGFGVWMMQNYAVTHMIETNIALASIAFILIGFFMLSTAITLYAIARMSEKFSKQS